MSGSGSLGGAGALLHDGEAMNGVSAVAWNPPVAAEARAMDPGVAIGELYGTHYQPLVRFAAMLIRDAGAAEEIVQDAFVALYGSWSVLRDPGKARAYLHRSVLNRSRSLLRHRAVAEKHAATLALQAVHSDDTARILADRSSVVAALRALPARQREALVLRFYADLSEADIARVMGISAGAVKSHTARGVTALRKLLADAATGPHRPPETLPSVPVSAGRVTGR
jgi:RNA polymerase sigma-70 factor (sigma-E family)